MGWRFIIAAGSKARFPQDLAQSQKRAQDPPGVRIIVRALLPALDLCFEGIQHRLHSLLVDQIREIRERPWEEMMAFSPELDVAAMGHEFDELRMFAS